MHCFFFFNFFCSNKIYSTRNIKNVKLKFKYFLKKDKTNELEIESGIESDSSSEHNNIAANLQFSYQIPQPPPPPQTPAPNLNTHKDNNTFINETNSEELKQGNKKI